MYYNYSKTSINYVPFSMQKYFIIYIVTEKYILITHDAMKMCVRVEVQLHHSRLLHYRGE
jgi:hypothetical protein